MRFFIKIPQLNSAIFLALLAFVLSGCGGNRFEEQIRGAHATVQNNLTQLKSDLDRKQLPNALLIEKYANALIQQKPDYNDIAQLLKKEATAEGKNYNKLVSRLAAVNLVPKNEREAQANIQELQLINAATDPGMYNDGLADVVNTLASMSDGKLASINVPRTTSASQAQGNALVGNPAYGNWQRDSSSGTSFWAWYGMYSMFNNVMGGGRYNYNRWSSQPNSSYYNNYGRERYGSYNDVSRNRDLSSRSPSKYNRSARTSPRYSKTAQRSSSFGSSRSSSRSSAYGSSSRSSSYSSSRGSRSGK